MARSDAEVLRLVDDLVGAHDRDLAADGRLGKVARYLRGKHDLPYAPRGAQTEYYCLARKAVTNWLPLISDTYAKALFVDGYRPARSADNAAPWAYWQANGLDARQTIAHRGALEHGVSYVIVLPGKPAPLMRPLSALRAAALYEDDDDEWAELGVVLKGKTVRGERLVQLLDDQSAYTVVLPTDSNAPRVVSTADHGLGVVPFVRFRDRLDGEACGIIRPLINIQDRVNEAVFSLMIAIQYASFRQRWATGLAIPEDENGNPVEPFQAAVDRLWISDSPDAKFGDFAQTEVSGHISNYESAVRSLAAIAQTPPHVLLGDLVNLSADALAAAEASTQRKASEYETLFGESWEQAFRLAALAAGDKQAAADTSAQVRWRDTEARSLAQTADALGKIAQMLQVPAEGLWERIPGVTDQDIERWRELASRQDGISALAAALNRHQDSAATPSGQPVNASGQLATPPPVSAQAA